MNNLVNISIIIPCRNEAKFIGRCIDSLLNNDFDKELIEILVVDGMSKDGTRTIIRTYAEKNSNIRLLDNPARITPAALNIGIRESVGKIIMRIDAHAVYARNYIQLLRDNLIKLDADNVGGVWITKPGGEGIIPMAISVASSSAFGIGNAWYKLGRKEVAEVDTVPYGCFKKELFDKIGLFDEELIRNQDDEFNARIKKNGGKIYLIPDARIEYFSRKTMASMARMFYQYGLYKPLVMIKIGSPATWRQMIPLLFFLYIILLLGVGILRFGLMNWVGIPLMLYIIISFLFSLKDSVRTGKPGLMVLLPLTFLIIHIGYGYGYFVGILKYFLIRPLQRIFKPS